MSTTIITYVREPVDENVVDTAEITEDNRVVHIGVQKHNSYSGSGGFDLKYTAAYNEVRGRDVAVVLNTVCPAFGKWIKPQVRISQHLVVLQTELSPNARAEWLRRVPLRSNHSMRLLQQPQCLSNLSPLYDQLEEAAHPQELPESDKESAFLPRLKRLLRF